MLSPLTIPGIEGPLTLAVHDGDDTCVSRQILTQRIWEPYETALVVEHLTTGGVFLDIGANIGYYTVIASRLVGEEGRVIAYEPDTENFALLERNLALNGCRNVEAFQAALSDRDGSGMLYLCADNRGDHRLYDDGTLRPSRPITLINAATHVPARSAHVDFIKVDTQGWEAAILRGLRDTCLANRDHLTMILEFWPYGLRQAGDSGTELLRILDRLELPCAVIDHLNFRLLPVTLPQLGEWVHLTEADPGNQGFINLFVSPAIS